MSAWVYAMLRGTLAFAAACLAPSSLVLVPYAVSLAGSDDSFAWAGFKTFATFVLATAVVYVVVLGVPAFLILRWRKAIRWWSSMLMGFALGCLPIAVDLWPEDDSGVSSSHWDGEKMVATVVNGTATLAGWIQYGQSVAVFGLFGAVGGLAFWLVWRSMRPRP